LPPFAKKIAIHTKEINCFAKQLNGTTFELNIGTRILSTHSKQLKVIAM